jgi:hypothetical protein
LPIGGTVKHFIIISNPSATVKPTNIPTP